MPSVLVVGPTRASIEIAHESVALGPLTSMFSAQIRNVDDVHQYLTGRGPFDVIVGVEHLDTVTAAALKAKVLR